MNASRNRAVFLDKDGTLIENIPYNVDPGRISLSRGAARGLSRLHSAGYAIHVISNQPGVAHGLFSESALEKVRLRICELLGRDGIPLAGFSYCPHHPKGSVPRFTQLCGCRKPKPGLIVEAAFESAIDLRNSWFIGDILDDVEAGRRAGCRTILIDNGNETEWRHGPYRTPDFTVTDLSEAAETILEEWRHVG